MRKLFLIVVSLLLAVVTTTAQEEESVFLRAAHFSADAPAVDVYVNGEIALEGLEFPDVSEFAQVDAGTYTVDVVPVGGAIEDAVLSGDYDLSAGDWATLAVIGEASRDSLAIQPIIDDLTATEDGETYISAFHAIADLDPVNVFVNETEIVTLLSYPEGELDGYASGAIVADTYDIQLQDLDGNTLLSLDDVTMGIGRAYFFAAVGTAANPQFVFIPTDVESLTTVGAGEFDEMETGEGTLLARIGHFAVSAPVVDVYLDGEMVLEGADFGDLTDYIEVDAGVYEVALVPTGEALENAAYTGEIALVEDTLTLVAAVGFVGDGSLDVVTALENNEAPDPGFTRIAYFQAVPSTELFNLSANDNILIQGVAYPEIFVGAGDGYVSVDVTADTYEISVDGAGNELNVGNITTGAGRVYLVVSAGVEEAPVFFLIPSDFPASE